MSKIIKVDSVQASAGSRGESNHVSGDGYSVHFWNLRNLVKGEFHTNPYDLAVYVTDGMLNIYHQDGTEVFISGGESGLVPANTTYSMDAVTADVVEVRVNPALVQA